MWKDENSNTSPQWNREEHIGSLYLVHISRYKASSSAVPLLVTLTAIVIGIRLIRTTSYDQKGDRHPPYWAWPARIDYTMARL